MCWPVNRQPVECSQASDVLGTCSVWRHFEFSAYLALLVCSAFWLVYFPVRLRELARQVAPDLEFCLLRRFFCVWNMYQLMDRRFPGGLCHLVYCVDLNDSSSLIRVTHNRMKHFLTWTHQAASYAMVALRLRWPSIRMQVCLRFIPWFASPLALENHG